MDILANSKDLIIKKTREVLLIPLKEICYIEKFGDYCIVRNKQGEIKIRTQLKKVGYILPKYFIKVNRSFIINATLISKIVLNEKNFYEVYFFHDNENYILINRNKLNLVVSELIEI